jgi:hypothetical protein
MDKDDKQWLTCLRMKLDESGNPVKDANGNPVPEGTDCLQNSGISIAVPAQLILDLAQAKNISLD